MSVSIATVHFSKTNSIRITFTNKTRTIASYAQGNSIGALKVAMNDLYKIANAHDIDFTKDNAAFIFNFEVENAWTKNLR